MNVLVCGGRDFNDEKLIFSTLNRLHTKYNFTCVIEGGASGADKIASQWAALNGIKNQSFKADWFTYGKRAGYLRNAKMLELGKPKLVIAFPGNKGTAMMIRLAKDAKVKVVQVGG